MILMGGEGEGEEAEDMVVGAKGEGDDCIGECGTEQGSMSVRIEANDDRHTCEVQKKLTQLDRWRQLEEMDIGTVRF